MTRVARAVLQFAAHHAQSSVERNHRAQGRCELDGRGEVSELAGGQAHFAAGRVAKDYGGAGAAVATERGDEDRSRCRKDR